MSVYTPLASIMIAEGCSTCTKIEFRGLEISVSMDNSCAPPYTRDLFRADIRIFDNRLGKGFTESDVSAEYGGPWHDAEGLYEAMNAIAKRAS